MIGQKNRKSFTYCINRQWNLTLKLWFYPLENTPCICNNANAILFYLFITFFSGISLSLFSQFFMRRWNFEKGVAFNAINSINWKCHIQKQTHMIQVQWIEHFLTNNYEQLNLCWSVHDDNWNKMQSKPLTNIDETQQNPWSPNQSRTDPNHTLATGDQ